MAKKVKNSASSLKTNQRKQYCITLINILKSNKPLKKSNNKSQIIILKQKKKQRIQHKRQKSQKTKKPKVMRHIPKKHQNQ